MRQYRVAVIPGDGIGKEVTPAAMHVVDAAGKRWGFRLERTEFPWGGDYYLEHKVVIPDEGMKQLAEHDAIYLGALGAPDKVPDHVLLRGSIIRIRQEFDLYINLRPVKVLEGVPGPLKDPGNVDMLCVRENSEGEYIGMGGRMKRGTPDEVVLQTAVFTRKGVERVMRYAFEEARRRRKDLACATKSNALNHIMVFWDEVCDEVARDYPDVRVRKFHIDALVARMVTHPHDLDVIVASNLFGDIITDLGGALQGSLGIPASANLDPTRNRPSMFEPVHGSAPDIAGRGIANPIAAVWAASMMLDFLGETEAARGVMAAVEQVAAAGQVRTPDLGGSNSTQEVAEAIAEAVATVSV